MSTAGRPKPAGDAVSISIVVRLLAAQNLLLSALRRGLGEDLSLARFDLLMQLHRDDGQTLATLSRRMLVTAGNLTGLVDRAERDGIVERRPDPNDRRMTRVWLTAKGAKVAAKAIVRHAEIAEELLRPLEQKERDDLRRLLGRLRQALDASVSPRPRPNFRPVLDVPSRPPDLRAPEPPSDEPKSSVRVKEPPR
jgi:DNA-binding MarR family transcriptional regulator